MGFHGGLRSWSRRTILFVLLAAAYYVALNIALIHELVDRVQAGPALVELAPADPLPSCVDRWQLDRDGCRAESMINKAFVMLGEQRVERRAAPEYGRAAPWSARSSARESAAGR